jgi:hypothetical protein
MQRRSFVTLRSFGSSAPLSFAIYRFLAHRTPTAHRAHTQTDGHACTEYNSASPSLQHRHSHHPRAWLFIIIIIIIIIINTIITWHASHTS